jgi:hypothetical protein
MRVTTVAIRNETHRRLVMLAFERDTVLTELVRQAIDEWLARHDRRSPNKH